MNTDHIRLCYWLKSWDGVTVQPINGHRSIYLYIYLFARSPQFESIGIFYIIIRDTRKIQTAITDIRLQPDSRLSLGRNTKLWTGSIFPNSSTLLRLCVAVALMTDLNTGGGGGVQERSITLMGCGRTTVLLYMCNIYRLLWCGPRWAQCR